MLCTKRAGWGVLDKDPNPASATNDDMTSCNSNELCRFFRFRLPAKTNSVWPWVKVLRVIWRLKNMLEIDDYTIKRQIIYS